MPRIKNHLEQRCPVVGHLQTGHDQLDDGALGVRYITNSKPGASSPFL